MPDPISSRSVARAPAASAAEKAARPPPCKAFSLAALDSRPPPPPLPAGPLSAPGATNATSATSATKRVLTRILDDESAVDRGLHAAMSGRQMSAPQLLVLQAQVIQYSQEVEVASRLVDKATGAIKQVLQTQV